MNDITMSAVSALKPGQEFKNYNELCKALSVKPKCGKSKILQMEDMDRFFTYTKQGHKIIIKEIYPEPKPKEENGRNSKYQKHIEYLLVQSLYSISNEGAKDITILYGLNDLAYNLSLVSDNFSMFQNQEWKADNLITDNQITSFYRASKTMIKGYIETALDSLQKNKEIDYTRERLLATPQKNGTYTYRYLTEHENNIYKELYKDTINSFNRPFRSNINEVYKTFRDIIRFGKVDEFYGRLNKAVEDNFGVGKKVIDNIFKISTTKKLLDYAKSRVAEYEDILSEGIELNNKLCEGMRQSKTLCAPYTLKSEENNKQTDRITKLHISPAERDVLIDNMICIGPDEADLHADALLTGRGRYCVDRAE